MYKNSFVLLCCLGFLFLFTQCNLEKSVDINLPDYESRPVLECYLEPGQPFNMLITKSAGFFDVIDLSDPDQYIADQLEQNAQVIIRHNGESHELTNSLIFFPESGRIANYISPSLTEVPFNYSMPFELEVTLENGQKILAETRILPPVPLDSVVYEFNSEDSARVLTYFSDDLNDENYYRRMIHEGSLDSVPNQDFITNDRFVDNETVVFGTGYEFYKGQTIYNTLFHVDRAYFEFLESVVNSVSANGNPFGQPGVIISNLTGDAEAIGIFTGLSYARDTTLIP